jgi:hypothetical protein
VLPATTLSSRRNISEINRSFSEHNRNISDSEQEYIVAVVDSDPVNHQLQQQQQTIQKGRSFSDTFVSRHTSKV